jgi:hypothetical protein
MLSRPVSIRKSSLKKAHPGPVRAARNYRSPRPTLVIRYTDRVEVQNAGHSLVEDENFGKPGSMPRNPKLV